MLLLAFPAIACGCGPQSTADETCAVSMKTPVLFVHGSGMTAKTWQTMIETFESAGYPPEFLMAIDMIPRDGDNIRAASRFIAPAVRSLLEERADFLYRHGCHETGRKKVDIVAHSMGAVSARWYTNRMSPESVRTLITIAGANHGTDRLCGRPGSGDAQLCPAFSESDRADNLQAILNGTRAERIDETPYGVGIDANTESRVAPTIDRRIRFFTIRIDPDEWIVPASSAILDGAEAIRINAERFPLLRETSTGNFLFLGNTGHDDLPLDPHLIRFVLFLLT